MKHSRRPSGAAAIVAIVVIGIVIGTSPSATESSPPSPTPELGRQDSAAADLDRLPADAVTAIIDRLGPDDLVRFAATSSVYRALVEDSPVPWLRAAFSPDTAELQLLAVLRVLARKVATCSHVGLQAEKITLGDGCILFDRIAYGDSLHKMEMLRALLLMNRAVFLPLILSDLLYLEWPDTDDLLLAQLSDYEAPPLPDVLTSDATIMSSVGRHRSTLASEFTQLKSLAVTALREPFGQVFPDNRVVSDQVLDDLTVHARPDHALLDPDTIRSLFQNGVRFDLCHYLDLNPNPDSAALDAIFPLLRCSMQSPEGWPGWRALTVPCPMDSADLHETSLRWRLLPYLPRLVRTPAFVSFLRRNPHLLSYITRCQFCFETATMLGLFTESFLAYPEMRSLATEALVLLLEHCTELPCAHFVHLAALPHLDVEVVLRGLRARTQFMLPLITDDWEFPSLYQLQDRAGRDHIRRLLTALSPQGRYLVETVAAC